MDDMKERHTRRLMYRRWENEQRKALSRRGLHLLRLDSVDGLCTFREGTSSRTITLSGVSVHVRPMIEFIDPIDPDDICDVHPEGDGPYNEDDEDACPCHWWAEESSAYDYRATNLEETRLEPGERPVW